MSVPNIGDPDLSSPITDDSLPTMCAQIYALMASTNATPSYPPSKRHRLKLTTSEDSDLTIYNARADLIQHPMARAASLRACGNSNSSTTTPMAVKCYEYQGTRILGNESQSESDSGPRSGPNSHAEGSSGFQENQCPEKGARISPPRIVGLLNQLERAWTDHAHDAFRKSKTLLETPDPSLSRFPGDIIIIIKDAALARLFALTEDAASRADAVGVTAGPFVGRTTFWADASCPANGVGDDARESGLGVVYRALVMPRGSDEWITEGYRIPAPVDVTVAETLAVLGALLIAVKRFRTRNGVLEKEQTVLIFSDCKDALVHIQHFESGKSCVNRGGVPDEIVYKILTNTQQLSDEGVKVELHWVPGHKGVPGNELADEVAKYAARGKRLGSRPKALKWRKPVGFEREAVSLDDDFA